MDIFNFCLVFISVLCAFVFLYTLSLKIFEYIRKKRIANFGIKNSNSKSKENFFTSLFRNGVDFLIRPSNFLLSKFKFIKNFMENLCSFLSDKSIKTKPDKILSVVIFFSFTLIILCSFIFGSLYVGLAIWLCILICLSLFIKSYKEKSIKDIRVQIPDTFTFMSSCFGAGLTIQQTFEQLLKESNSKIKSIFLKCYQTLQTGGSVSDSLKCLQNIKEFPELSFVSVALDVQHQTGGSMQPVIDSAKDMAENKLELLRMLSVQTAQAKLSARIIIILPFALIALFSIISPGFINAFFGSFIGIVMFCIACIMEAAGIIIVRKMLEINL